MDTSHQPGTPDILSAVRAGDEAVAKELVEIPLGDGRILVLEDS